MDKGRRPPHLLRRGQGLVEARHELRVLEVGVLLLLRCQELPLRKRRRAPQWAHLLRRGHGFVGARHELPVLEVGVLLLLRC